MKPRFMVIRLPDSFPSQADQADFLAACRFVSIDIAALSAGHPKATQADQLECSVGMLVVHPDDAESRQLYKSLHRELGRDASPENGWHERIEAGVGLND
jgi:hypothetical protein